MTKILQYDIFVHLRVEVGLIFKKKNTGEGCIIIDLGLSLITVLINTFMVLQDEVRAIEVDDNFDGPLKKRSCTDIPCLIIFIAFLGGMVSTCASLCYYVVCRGMPESENRNEARAFHIGVFVNAFFET